MSSDYDPKWEKRSASEKLDILDRKIGEEMARWKNIFENGCSDPHWPDGTNLNLVRNHIIYYLRQVQELSQEPKQLSIFEMGLPGIGEIDISTDQRIPPKVPENYMARDRTCSYFNGR